MSKFIECTKCIKCEQNFTSNIEPCNYCNNIEHNYCRYCGEEIDTNEKYCSVKCKNEFNKYK